ncbi:MAG: AI-2E family transporter [Armatimonadota bacterium]
MKQHILTGVILMLILLGIILAAIVVLKLTWLVLLVLIAIVLTTGIDPAVSWLQRWQLRGRHLPRGVATLLVMLFGLLVILGIVAFLVVTVTQEAIIFADNTWPQLQEHFLHWLANLSSRYPFIPNPDEFYQRLSAQSSAVVGYIWSTTKVVFGFLGGLFSLVILFILTLFFTIYKHGIIQTMLQFVPPRYQARTQEVAHLIETKMGGWLRGQLLLALLTTGMISVGMLSLQVPYAFLIAIIGGIGELIPMVGPYIAFFPALVIVLATGGSFVQVLLLVLVFAVITQVENYILYPKVMERHVKLSPVTTILALFMGGGLFGIVGALLAVPFAAAGRVVMLEVVFPIIQGKARERAKNGDNPAARNSEHIQAGLSLAPAPPPIPSPSPSGGRAGDRGRSGSE